MTVYLVTLSTFVSHVSTQTACLNNLPSVERMAEWAVEGNLALRRKLNAVDELAYPVHTRRAGWSPPPLRLNILLCVLLLVCACLPARPVTSC